MYVGLGNGAHGFVADEQGVSRRYANLGSTEAYLQVRSSAVDEVSPASGIGDRATGEIVSSEMLAVERIMLGLRRERGVHFDSLSSLVPAEKYAKWCSIAEEIARRGFAYKKGEWLCPTPKGMLLADSLAEEFF